MQKTKVTVTIGKEWHRYEGKIYTELVNNGIWRIDNSMGKTLCIVNIFIPELGVKISFVPADSFQDELIQNWLEAEKRNDNFKFKRPLREGKRPQCLYKKIMRIMKLLTEGG